MFASAIWYVLIYNSQYTKLGKTNRTTTYAILGVYQKMNYKNVSMNFYQYSDSTVLFSVVEIINMVLPIKKFLFILFFKSDQKLY